ncbi:hypothetical protein D1797_15550 [Salmonella enterica subsp. enterica serovar Freetown]|nr:hypothetical protein [Salmonella enterica subsp. enterica serovar Freetown]EBH8792747.1 hypothetical protein [Salmonella enterica subsp. enterica serovar Freetown]EBN9932863.1 hypothetical protein [Salmonella enterica]
MYPNPKGPLSALEAKGGGPDVIQVKDGGFYPDVIQVKGEDFLPGVHVLVVLQNVPEFRERDFVLRNELLLNAGKHYESRREPFLLLCFPPDQFHQPPV